jgi:hypothetical protein
MNQSKVLYSELQYRHNPADASQGKMDLGWAMEFTTSRYWVVALALRATLDEKLIAELDELTRKLLEHRMDVLTRELEQILPSVRRLGDAVGMLAAHNPWSIHVVTPRSLILTDVEQRASDKASAEKLAEDYMLRIFEQSIAQPVDARGGPASLRPDSSTLRITPPWMLPPKTMMRPLGSLRS